MANSNKNLEEHVEALNLDEKMDSPEKIALSGNDEVSDECDDDDDDLEIENEEDIDEELPEEEKQRRRGEALDYKNQGNQHFKEEKYSQALRSYKRALKTCPKDYKNDRAVFHSNKAACFQHLEQNDDAINECTKALELKEAYIKARLRRANIYEATDKLDEALEDYKKILEFEPLHRDALAASRELPPRIHERNEKMKTEMMGKLKDLGNLVLRPFGLSTDNFKVQQDPNSGGYSINFQQNK